MTKEIKQERPSGKKPKSLTLKIFLYLALFTLFILLILWLFQTVFMDGIYQRIKLSDMKRCADEVSLSISEGTVTEDVISISSAYNACVSVYQITNGNGQVAASSHIQTTCMIHNLSSDEFLNDMYKGAKDDKYYIQRVSMSLSDENVPIMSGGTKEDNPSAVVCATSVAKGQSDYLVLVDTEILPLVSTTRTLTYQLAIISVILFIAALIMSLIISEKIANPFKKMTKEASRLAEGRYDVNFDTQSFMEAKELGDSLNYAAGELSKLDTMQKELIANISHDLRTPLTMISGYSEVMRDIPGEMTAENMQVIIDETARLSSLVTDLLELSRISNDTQKIYPGPFNLTEAVRKTLDRYTHLVQKEGYKFVFRSDCEAHVIADETRILQVVYNLINNAINYTGEDKTVTVSQTVTGNTVRISVTDTGEGIPKEQLPLIWERYYKVQNFHKRAKTGTGLGLSIVKNILLIHNAPFGVTSTVGEGSTFWFELPLDS